MVGRDTQTNAVESGAVLKRKQYSILVFHSPAASFIGIIEDDGKGGKAL